MDPKEILAQMEEKKRKEEEKKQAAAAAKALKAGDGAKPSGAMLKRPAAAGCIGSKPIPSLARAYRARDFSEFVQLEDREGYTSEGSWTSRAYKKVVYHTGDIGLAREAYAAALGAWKEP